MTEQEIKQLEDKIAQMNLRKDTEIKAFYEEYYGAINTLAEAKGVEHMFQDGSGIVYQVVKPSGTFVQYRDVNIIRTRREGEKAGDLSMTKAREAGFEVEGKSI